MASLALLGARGVGKVTLLRKFDEDKNPLGMQLCYGNEIRVFVDGKCCYINFDSVHLPIFDESDDTKVEKITDKEGFAMVYSVTDRSSFEEIEKLHRDILRLKECSYIPMFLVGNKCDSDLERVVSYTQGEVLAKSLGVKFIETSAKYGDNVDQLFFDLVRDIWKNQEIKSTDSEESLLFPEESEDSEPKRRKCCFL